MVLAPASQDFTHAALPIFLPYKVTRPHLWLLENDCLRMTKPRSHQLRKPILKPSQTVPTPDYPAWPRQPAFRPCSEAGSHLGICPILLSHLCLQDLRVGPHLVSLTLIGTGPQTHRNAVLALASALFCYFYF